MPGEPGEAHVAEETRFEPQDVFMFDAKWLDQTRWMETFNAPNKLTEQSTQRNTMKHN